MSGVNYMMSDVQIYTWVILPVLIFLARVCDVTLGTIRVIFVSKGFKYLSAILGFIEITIWLSAMRQIMINLSNPLCFAAFAGGFSMGTFTGIWIAEKLSLGKVIVRVVTKKDAKELIETLQARNYGVTYLDAHGQDGPVQVIFMVIDRHDLQEVTQEVQKYNPQAFYTIEEVRSVQKGIFPPHRNGFNLNLLRLGGSQRKSK